MKIRRSQVLDFLLNTLEQVRVFDLLRLVNAHALTVLNYHRINDPHQESFDTFKPNVSATPLEFARQLDYVKEHYNVINCVQLADWLAGKRALPSRAAIITFDDGYYDNFQFAYPALRERNLPAVIFLTTGFIGSAAPSYWDYVAYCFHHTQRDHADLPVTGNVHWQAAAVRENVMLAWIESLKKLPEMEKQKAIASIADLLDVSVPDGIFSKLYLNWDQVLEMNRGGIEFGSHTATHPILTRIPLEQVRNEVVLSKKKIEEMLGQPVISFAYPNGQLSDFSPQVVNEVRQSGIQVAFTLLPGPMAYSKVKNNNLSVSRIFLLYQDTFPRFLGKISGLGKLRS